MFHLLGAQKIGMDFAPLQRNKNLKLWTTTCSSFFWDLAALAGIKGSGNTVRHNMLVRIQNWVITKDLYQQGCLCSMRRCLLEKGRFCRPAPNEMYFFINIKYWMSFQRTYKNRWSLQSLLVHKKTALLIICGPKTEVEESAPISFHQEKWLLSKYHLLKNNVIHQTP
jgi:hypothetical protein